VRSITGAGHAVGRLTCHLARRVAARGEPLPTVDRRAADTRETDRTEPEPDRHLFATYNEGLVCLSGCARDGLAVRNGNGAAELASVFGRDRFFVELQRPYERGDAQRNARLRQLAETIGVQTVVTGNVHAHNRRRALLQDAMVAIRNRTSLEGAERERRGNHECVLLAPDALAERFPDDRDAVARTAELAERLEFDLTQELGYRYPDFSDDLIAELYDLQPRIEERWP
jgi:error-prone DNA polymerase